jgi:hypothetical protein
MLEIRERALEDQPPASEPPAPADLAVVALRASRENFGSYHDLLAVPRTPTQRDAARIGLRNPTGRLGSQDQSAQCRPFLIQSFGPCRVHAPYEPRRLWL